MKRTVMIWLLLAVCFRPVTLLAQPDTPVMAAKLLREEQEIFLDYINFIPIDSNIAYRLSVFIESEVDSIRTDISRDAALSDAVKTRALNSMTYLMKELSANLALQKFEVYDIPSALESYKQLLDAILHRRSYTAMLKPIGPRRCLLLAAAFWQYPDYDYLNDVASYKRMAESPAHILQFLEGRPGFRFSDSLLLVAAAQEPYKLVEYLDQHPSGFSDSIRKIRNIYLQQLISISGYKNVSDLIPFVVPLAEKRISMEEILDKRRDATCYYQLMVDMLQQDRGGYADTAFQFLIPLRKAIKNESLAFYVNGINELHSAPYEVRFAAIKNLRIEDLYYIITSCKDELYTSSYLGVYRQLVKNFSTTPADSLFGIVDFDNFRPFMKMAANYNTLADFLSCMPEERTISLLKRLISGIETDTHTGLEFAMDVADAFSGFDSVPGLGKMTRDELRSNLERCRSSRQYFGMRLYSILLEVFDMLNKKDPGNKLWASLGNHEILKRRSLENKNAEVVEMVLFYGDEDGRDSYNNFMCLFTNPNKWQVTETTFWVAIRSRTGPPMRIYANLPMDDISEMDLKAQDTLAAWLKEQGSPASILVHRGHSYHLDHTLKKLTPSVKLTLLGSCGGYNNILSVAHISQEAQIIVSKKTGSKFINDPIIEVINETLAHGRDLVWLDIWEKLRIRFSKNAFMLNLFNEYIPPGRNVSLFVYKLFNYYR